MTRLSD